MGGNKIVDIEKCLLDFFCGWCGWLIVIKDLGK